MRKLLIISLTILAVLTSCSNKNEKTDTPRLILSYADNQPAQHPTTSAAWYFAALVEKYTDGVISVEVYSDGQIGSEISVYEQMKFGGVDFGRYSLGILSQFYPDLAVLELPYLYEDSDHMWRVLDGEIGSYFLSKTADSTTIALAWFDAGARSFYTIEPIVELDQLEGKKIRVQEIDLMARFVEPLGVTAEKIPYGEVYSALQRGIIDGAENNIPSYYYTGHYQAATHVYLDEHFRIPELLMMSGAARAKIEALGEEYLPIIEECAAKAAEYERILWKKAESDSLSKVLEYGCTVVLPTAAEKEEMRQLMTPIYEEYSEYADIIEKIRNT